MMKGFEIPETDAEVVYPQQFLPGKAGIGVTDIGEGIIRHSRAPS